MRFIWDLFFTWDLFWDLFEIYLRFIWDLFEIYLRFIWDLFFPPDLLFLKKNWDLFEIYFLFRKTLPAQLNYPDNSVERMEYNRLRCSQWRNRSERFQNSTLEGGFSNSNLNVFLTILDAGETIFGSFSSSCTYLPLESYLQKCF